MTLETFLIAALFSGAVMAVGMVGAFLIERRTGNSGWIDVAWTVSVGATGVLGALIPFGDGDPQRKLLVIAMASAWSLRLALHIGDRSQRIKEDPRYAEMRKEWGDAEGEKMFRLLQMQALASVPLVLAIILAAHNPTPGLRLQDAAALTVFLVGIAGSALADRQLRAFVRRTGGKGGVCQDGLWGWSRHPNYFFECIVWASWPVMAVSPTGYPFGYVAILAPVGIAWLLLKISGIPPLEQHMVRKHGDAYRNYQRRVSAFVPLPPRKAA